MTREELIRKAEDCLHEAYKARVDVQSNPLNILKSVRLAERAAAYAELAENESLVDRADGLRVWAYTEASKRLW